ncbi:MAG TPA: alpha/beta hydrolase-fold protein [Anaerolineales bacterium]|nr:alpha/beta hydrolase-fold protein [Anaerolineales bacterium]
MKSSFPIYSLMISLALSQVVSACTPQTPPTPEPPTATVSNSALPNVTLPGSEVRQIKSSETGRDYDIYIRPPDDYARDKNKKYPVLYLLDGQWDFKLLDSIYGGLYYDGFVPEMIIVSITYSGVHPDYESLRAMDYTPFHDPYVQGSGDAPKFLAFLKKELFPLIESDYRIDTSRRVLMGHSFGGTFTLYAMFSEPELFSGYVAGSPAVVFGDNFAFKQEAEYASTHQDLPVRLYLFVGGEEDLKYPVEEFMQVLGDRNYPGLELETRTLEGERHAGVKPEGFNRGLRYIFYGK